jgi:hypothetical protein
MAITGSAPAGRGSAQRRKLGRSIRRDRGRGELGEVERRAAADGGHDRSLGLAPDPGGAIDRFDARLAVQLCDLVAGLGKRRAGPCHQPGPLHAAIADQKDPMSV